MLSQRLQALENRTVLNLIEGKLLAENTLSLNHFDEIRNQKEVSKNNPSDDESLESYGEF